MSNTLNIPIDLREASARMATYLTAAKNPLIAIVGTTASGKTAFSLEMAKRAQALGKTVEIVNADSRQLYRRLTIGTAKIRPEEMKGIPHHLIDVLDPREEVTIAWYQKEALRVIGEIHKRGAVPLLVGGSMLYVSSVIDGLQPLETDPALRKRIAREYDELGPERLHQKLREIDPDSALGIDPRNKIYLVRALEIALLTGEKPSVMKRQEHSAFDLLMFGIAWPREELTRRIDERTAAMIERGWIEEVEQLLKDGYRPNDPAMKSHGYREIVEAISSGSVDRQQLIKTIAAKTRQYAKRQMTWWRHDERIIWVDGRNSSG